jgi:hypothetical protein
MRERTPSPKPGCPDARWGARWSSTVSGIQVAAAGAPNEGGIMKSFTLGHTLAWLAALVLLIPIGRIAAQNQDSAEITKLLNDVRNHAALAEDDANTLESFTRSKLHSRTHSTQLSGIKEHVNDLIRDSNELSTMRDLGSPWQQSAIDRINPLLREMASSLTSTMVHFNENLNRTQMKPYRELVLNNQTVIRKAHEIISDFVDYGEAKAKAEALEKDLQISSASEPGV